MAQLSQLPKLIESITDRQKQLENMAQQVNPLTQQQIDDLKGAFWLICRGSFGQNTDKNDG